MKQALTYTFNWAYNSHHVCFAGSACLTGLIPHSFQPLFFSKTSHFSRVFGFLERFGSLERMDMEVTLRISVVSLEFFAQGQPPTPLTPRKAPREAPAKRQTALHRGGVPVGRAEARGEEEGPGRLSWLWVKNRYPKWNPSKCKHGLKSAVPW